jgi:hypothetical protein
MQVDGGGVQIQGSDASGHLSFTVRNRAATAQTVVVELTPTLGGGNYALSVLHAGGS